MHIFTMIVWIVAIFVVGDIIKRRMSHKENKATSKSDDDEIEKLIKINQELGSRIKALESRVINLEAIVTDESYELKQKIGDL